MKKCVLSFFVIVLISLSLQAQGLYKIKYQSNNTTYEALLAWYGTGQQIMRIKYFDTRLNRTLLVQQNVEYVNQGAAGEFLRGSNAVYLSTVPAGYKYFADHFIFQKVNGYYACTGTIDDQNLTGEVQEFRPLYQFEVTDALLQQFGFNRPDNSNVNNASNAVMHLIIVADIEDREIGQASKVDIAGIEREFRAAADKIGITLRKTPIIGSGFNRTNVVKTLNDLYPGSNDIVVFVYTGHGFRFNDDTNSYPRLSLTRNRESVVGNNLLASEIYNSLKKKNSRLNITLIDACNSKIGFDKPSRDGGIALKPSDAGISRAAVAALFLNTRGNLIVSAASKGEYAYTNSRSGGFFIHSFLDAFMNETSVTNSSSPNWDNIIKKARNYAYQRTAGKQTAVYYTELR